jgi:MFS transporter, DHA1 family, inner membrane transport protein
MIGTCDQKQSRQRPSKPRDDLVHSDSRLAAAGVVGALALASFSYVTSENLPIGLLELMADDLAASRSAVGLLVSGFAVTVAAVSLPMTRLTSRVPRRRLISGLLALFVVTTVVAALAANYWVLLVARIGTALAQAVFWAVVAPVATSMFPPRIHGRVVSLVFGGGSLAIVLGVPAGTWLGQQAGWRVAFLALSAVGALTFLAVIVLLPNAPARQGHAGTGTHPDARRYRILVLTTGLAVAGAFTAYTYVVPFLTQVSGFSASVVSALLLAYGVADLMGTVTAGLLVDRAPQIAIVAPVAALSVALVGLFLVGPFQAPVVALEAVAGLALAMVPTVMQSRILRVAPGSTEMASAAMSAAFNLGIAGGSLTGGVLLPIFGVRSTALAGGLLAVAALAVIGKESRGIKPPWRTPATREERTAVSAEAGSASLSHGQGSCRTSQC